MWLPVQKRSKIFAYSLVYGLIACMLVMLGHSSLPEHTHDNQPCVIQSLCLAVPDMPVLILSQQVYWVISDACVAGDYLPRPRATSRDPPKYS